MKGPAVPPAAPDLENLTPEQRALLMLRLRRQAQRGPEGAGAAPAPRVTSIPRAPRDRPLPLSFGQRRLWLTDRLQPGNPAYNVPFAFRVAGRLDGVGLDAAFAGIVRRHESLRTRFVADPLEDVEPLQVVGPPAPVPVPRVDLGNLPEDTRLAEARRLAAEVARHPFELESGRLLRVVLLALGTDDHALLTVLHHIAADAWSIGIFIREFIALYQAHLEKRPPALPELPVQYPDYAAWQREHRAEELAAQASFWKERLSGIPALDLPADRPRPAALSGRGAQTSRWWQQPVLEGLRAFARRQGVTVFMSLLAAFQALLARSTGQDDVSVGTPVAGRGREELEPLIGFFINTLVLRTDLSGDPSFSALLARVREATVEAFAHQDVPFEQVVEAVRPGGAPLFRVMFNYQSRPEVSAGIPGVELSRLQFEAGVSMFDLTLDCREIGDSLLVETEYSTDLFDAPTVERLLGHLETLLAAALAGPMRPFSELPLLSPAERHAVLTEWNDTPGETWDTKGFVHAQFADQARRAPDSLALVFGEEGEGAWTYAELRRRAGSLARRLRSLGVGPEVRVGICAGRTPERVASVLAVLKAGGAFVPLDPDDPRERLAWIFEDARPAVLLAEERLRGRLPEGARFLPLESAWEEGGDPPDCPRLSPENAAYVIYTSGSTGRPKGVVVPHRGIAASARAWQEEYGLTGRVRSLLQVAGFSFDVFIGDLVRALTTGAELVLAPAGVLTDPALLHGWLSRRRIDFADLVPAVARALVEHLEAVDATL
ncbi:MAG TPA: condensation domain-containing protein, partial [Thermoanaerobaculia bacterium]|nr:condensation domain-containing protein [Thermoanaerobaculia bacterium]